MNITPEQAAQLTRLYDELAKVRKAAENVSTQAEKTNYNAAFSVYAGTPLNQRWKQTAIQDGALSVEGQYVGMIRSNIKEKMRNLLLDAIYEHGNTIRAEIQSLGGNPGPEFKSPEDEQQAEQVEAVPAVVLVGNLHEGYMAHGPFQGLGVAADYGEALVTGNGLKEYSVFPLRPPVPGTDRTVN